MRLDNTVSINRHLNEPKNRHVFGCHAVVFYSDGLDTLGRSVLWKIWRVRFDSKTCGVCKKKNGTIYGIDDSPVDGPPLHPRCRCWLEAMRNFPPGAATNNGTEGADWWLVVYGKPPNYYISYADAIALGWNPEAGNLGEVLPGRMIARGVFRNSKGKLPDAPGRIWYEADINYLMGYRNTHRILFSNDGLIFVTYNHYKTFIAIGVGAR